MILYREASRILQLVEEKKSTVKNLCFSSKYTNKKQLFALVCETAKYNKILNEILSQTKLQKLEKSLKDPHLAKVLLYDFLFGNGIHNGGNLKEVVERHSSSIKAQLARIKIKNQVSNDKDLLNTIPKAKDVKLPRYVRVNTLKTTVEDVIEHFCREDYQQLYSEGLDYTSYLELLKSLDGKQFVVDIHIPQLLVFPSRIDLHEHVLYTSGHIILQDKASCLPALVLNPPPGCHVIDCCAAPGNKTTFLAAMMDDKGKIFAFDKDLRRLSTMNMLSIRAGSLCIDSSNQDFLKVDSSNSKYSNVKYILVDPSCSGSGIVGRSPMEMEDGNSSKEASRLKSLANFQAMILSHAFSFPSVQRIVYSTCSVNEEENEQVVHEVFEKFKNKYDLLSILPSFPCRGNADVFPEAPRCVRMNPEENLTNGFFIACFDRKENRGSGIVEKDSLKPKARKTQESECDNHKTELEMTGHHIDSEGNKDKLNVNANKKKKKKKTSRTEDPEPMEIDTDSRSAKESGKSSVVCAEDGKGKTEQVSEKVPQMPDQATGKVNDASGNVDHANGKTCLKTNQNKSSGINRNETVQKSREEKKMQRGNLLKKRQKHKHRKPITV